MSRLILRSRDIVFAAGVFLIVWYVVLALVSDLAGSACLVASAKSPAVVTLTTSGR